MKRKKKPIRIPAFYYRVEHPSLKLVRIDVMEFEGILARLGYEIQDISTYKLRQWQ